MQEQAVGLAALLAPVGPTQLANERNKPRARHEEHSFQQKSQEFLQYSRAEHSEQCGARFIVNPLLAANYQVSAQRTTMIMIIN